MKLNMYTFQSKTLDNTAYMLRTTALALLDTKLPHGACPSGHCLQQHRICWKRYIKFRIPPMKNQLPIKNGGDKNGNNSSL